MFPQDCTILRYNIGNLPNGWLNRSEEHTSELQSRPHLVCRLLLEKNKLFVSTAVRVEINFLVTLFVMIPASLCEPLSSVTTRYLKDVIYMRRHLGTASMPFATHVT